MPQHRQAANCISKLGGTINNIRVTIKVKQYVKKSMRGTSPWCLDVWQSGHMVQWPRQALLNCRSGWHMEVMADANQTSIETSDDQTGKLESENQHHCVNQLCLCSASQTKMNICSLMRPWQQSETRTKHNV